MKRFSLLFMSLLGLFGLVNLSAQDYDYEPDYDNPLIQEVWQFSSPYSDFLNKDEDGNEYVDASREGSFYALIEAEGAGDAGYPTQDFWHSSWHSYPVHDVQGSHYFQVEMLDPETLPDQIVFVFTRRDAANDHTTEWSVRGTNDPDATKEQCEELAYILTPWSSNTETLISKAFDPSHYQYLRFYSEAQYPSNRVYFHLKRFQLYPMRAVPEYEAALNMLSDAFDKYYGMYDSFPTGVEPGQYGEEEVAYFQEMVLTLDADFMSDEEREALTKAKAQELIDAVEAAYQAVLASKVTFGLTSGYYRIRAGMEYRNDVVVGKDDEGQDIVENMVRDKYMMGHKQDGKYWGIWGTPEDFKEETWKIRPLFKVTNKGDGIYDIESMMYNTRFTQVARSTSVEMSQESDTLMALDAAGTMNDISYVNIRVASQPAGDYFYLHQNNHSNGTGKNGFLVGWTNTWDEYDGPRASEWYFEPVDEAEANAIIEAWKPYRDRDAWLAEYHALYDEAKAAVEAAKDVAHIALITSVDQLSSPFTEPNEGSLENLIDGKTDNFWHSIWSGSAEYEGHHYLQVTLNEVVTDPVNMTFTRRNADNDHTIKWSIRGATTDEWTPEDECEELLNCETPYNSKTETLSTPTFDTKGYTILRIYSEEQKGSNYGSRTYWHVSELNLYANVENPNSQYSAMGQVAVDLDNVLDEQKEIEDADLTQADFDKLSAAYEAFKGEFVDPAELRDILAQVDGKTASVAVGTNPGFWPDMTTAEALDATIEAAKAYDVAGVYTKTKSTEFIETLKAQAEAYDKAVNLVKPGKWYRFRYGTEEEYEEHGWPTTGNGENYDEDAGVVRDEALYGKYVVVADFTEADDVREVEAIDAGDVVLNNYIFLDEDDDITDKDLSLFRFISVGDSAYVIQNKATGLFLLRPDNERFMRLSASPSLFTQGIAGWGQNYFSIKNLDNKGLEALHAASRYNILQTWGGWGDTDGRRGCFFVEEAEDVAADYDGTAFQIAAKPGTVTSFCFPVSIKGEDNMYTVNSFEQTADGIILSLAKLTEVAAGRPFLYIFDGVYDAEAEDEDYFDYTHGYDIVKETVDGNVVKGAIYPKQVGEGVITIANNKFTVTKSPNATTGESSAYIVSGDETFNSKLPVSYIITDQGDNIQETLQKVARTGDIYTLDGRLVGRGSLKSLRQKGVYIINGVKVLVK